MHNLAARLIERFTAVRTSVRAFPRVDTFVHAQARFDAECLGTERALERSLGSVTKFVVS